MTEAQINSVNQDKIAEEREQISVVTKGVLQKKKTKGQILETLLHFSLNYCT